MADLTQFDIASAQRIANVVRAVENTPPATEPLRFRRVLQDSPGKVFRVATFTGAWAINSAKVVTFKNQEATPNTTIVQNLLFPLPSLSTATSNPTVCVIGKDGTAWYVLNVVHSGHDILTGASLTPSNLQFTRRNGMSISTTAATTGISASSCDTKASAAQLSSFLG